MGYTLEVECLEFKSMKQSLVLILLLLVNMSLAVANELLYPDPQSTTTEQNRRAGSVVIKELFRDSDFVLVPRSVPGPYRMVLEMADKRLDIVSVAIHNNMIPLLPSEVGTIYPQPVFRVPVRHYALRDSGLNAGRNNPDDYRLGTIYMPKELLGSISDHPLESVELYNSYLSVAKGLLAKRVDRIAGSALELGIVFKELGIENDVIMVEESLVLDVHFIYRASLPVETQEAIIKLIDQRLPQLKPPDKLRELFEKNNLDFNSVFPVE